MYAAGFDPTKVSAISRPDNIAFDSSGNLWIATDGQPSTLGMNDGSLCCANRRAGTRLRAPGDERRYGRRFSSLAFTPNNETLFVSIQHPGEGSTYADPTSLWPDGHTPPRPGVVAVVRTP